MSARDPGRTAICGTDPSAKYGSGQNGIACWRTIPYMKRWHFTEHEEYSSEWWTWQLVGSDGVIERAGEGFRSYGESVADAIRQGFHPRNDDWVVEGKFGVARFGRGFATSRPPKGDGGTIKIFPASITRGMSLRGK